MSNVLSTCLEEVERKPPIWFSWFISYDWQKSIQLVTVTRKDSKNLIIQSIQTAVQY